MFKKALQTAFHLVFSPQTAWEDVKKKDMNLYKEFLIPLWSIILLAAFVGGLFISRDGGFELGIKNTIVEAFTLFVGFHVSSYFLKEYIRKMPDIEQELKTLKLAQIFVAYATSGVYLIQIMVALVNDFFFLWLFALYTFYIVYIGAETYFNLISERKSNFMIVASLLILGTPLVLKYCLSMMMTT